MKNPPKYFESIREKARNRWEQLDNDPELAGPWHQLFKQVQSPRHVISELLQNADDAEATEASVSIENGEFVFSHNGVDFTEEHFASLCRFGYSNKRSLHTIGFRGIGFKSTFSLGESIELFTPSLAVKFRSEHFTEPIWIDDNISRERTDIRVVIKDKFCLKELEKNMEEWKNSSTSLLFFSNIKTLRINGHEISWTPVCEGPVKGSKWYAASTKPEDKILLIKSVPEEFPQEAMDEIRRERMIKEDEISFPPCSIDVVLGIKGRLYVILPTGVSLNTPFACNAPFIQDPARVNIKDPSVSYTNRWLLGRVGRIVSSSLLEWIEKTEYSVEERSRAYDLLTDIDRDDKSLNGSCATIIEEVIDNDIRTVPFLLTEFGELCLWGKSTAIHRDIFEIWNSTQVATYFNKYDRKVLSHYISHINQKKLISWGCINELSMMDILGVLKSKRLPKPDTWNQLRKLWSLLADDLSGYHESFQKALCIVPVQGHSVLYSSSTVVRLGEKQLLRDKDDWMFLSEYLIAFNQNWSRYLSEQKREAEESKNKEIAIPTDRAYRVLYAIGMHDTSSASVLINRVAKVIYAENDVSEDKIVRIAQIAAQLGVIVAEDFPYLTQKRVATSAKLIILADLQGALSQFMPPDWYRSHIISDTYNNLASCTQDEWRQWILGGRSRLHTFIPLQQSTSDLWGRSKLQDFLLTRGYERIPSYPYVTHHFIIEDWEFPNDIWQYWINTAREDRGFWCMVLNQILTQNESYWSKTNSMKVHQVSTSGSTRQIIYNPVLPKWIAEFRNLPCLQDTHGVAHVPSELLMRNANTEALMDVEPFVRGDLDNASTKSILLLLGVRDSPTGPQAIMERIVLLAALEAPPIMELLKWYSRLDVLYNDCSTEDRNSVKESFQKKQLILTESKEWATSMEVFLDTMEDEFSDLATVVQPARGLSLWHKIGVKDKPSPDYVIEWLKTIESGSTLTSGTLKRVRALTAKYPDTIWSETRHWINLESQWVPTNDLKYALSMQTLVQWKHLFKSIKQQTADLTRIAASVCNQSPFNKLKNLVDAIVEQKDNPPNTKLAVDYSEWIVVLGKCLMRVKLDNVEETERICDLSSILSRTQICYSDDIKITPYIDNIPVGISRSVNCLWSGNVLYVIKKSEAQLANTVSQEIGKFYTRQDVMDAVKMCYARTREFIIDYCVENFNLSDMDFTETREQTEDKTEENAKKADSQQKGDTEQNESSDTNGKEAAGNQDDNASNNSEAEDNNTGTDESGGKNHKSKKHNEHAEIEPLIVRYARMKGYKSTGEKRFEGPNGDYILHSPNLFPWELYNSESVIKECFWLKEHCLRRCPMQIDAAVLSLIRDHPELYTLVLIDEGDNPMEIKGDRLNQLIDSENLTVFPDKLRLVMKNL